MDAEPVPQNCQDETDIHLNHEFETDNPSGTFWAATEAYRAIMNGDALPNRVGDGEDDIIDSSTTKLLKGTKEVKKLVQIQGDSLNKDDFTVWPADRYRKKRTSEKKDPNERWKAYPIVFRSIFSNTGVLMKHALEINSVELQEIIRSAAKHLDKQIKLDSNPIVFAPPYKPLFFLRHRLEVERKSRDDQEPISQELKTLLDFINSGDCIKNLIEEYERQVPHGKISFSLLWTIFEPQSIIYKRPNQSEEGELFVLESAEIKSISSQSYLRLNSVFGHHAGKSFGIRRRGSGYGLDALLIPSFRGLKEISHKDLEIIPLSFVSEHERKQIWETMVERGKRFVRIQASRSIHMQYEGPFKTQDSSFQPTQFQDTGGFVEVKGRVMIDSFASQALGGLTFGSHVAHCVRELFGTCPTPTENDPMEEVEHSEEGGAVCLSETDYAICPESVWAFPLSLDVWGKVSVSKLDEVVWEEDSFKFLELEGSMKDIIESLASSFTGEEGYDEFDDVVRGKGKGLIFLLHGAPGLGKTLTAETIAEHTRRPLYPITCPRLMSSQDIEAKLKIIFELGWRWGAVVLLDEADMILSKQDVSRTPTEAAFLRQMEYYKGLLFLTTNRVEGFDEAFRNRVHLAIKYPDLSPESRGNIWRNLLTRSPRRPELDGHWPENVFSILGKLQTNGRDIKNTIRTAHGIAKSKATPLAVEHILQVIKITQSGPEADQVAKELDEIKVPLA